MPTSTTVTMRQAHRHTTTRYQREKSNHMTARQRWQATQQQQRRVSVRRAHWDLLTARRRAILLALKLLTLRVSNKYRFTGLRLSMVLHVLRKNIFYLSSICQTFLAHLRKYSWTEINEISNLIILRQAKHVLDN